MTQHALTTGVRPSRRSSSDHGPRWRVPVALVGLVAIPMVGGSLRLLEVLGGPQLLPGNARITASPAPLIVHIVAAAVFALVGAFQFPARLRRTHRNWHRRAGRLLVVAGTMVAGSGLWMTLFYPDAPGGVLLWTVRLLVASAVAVSLALGFFAIRRRDIAEHRAWMIRAYALSVAAGTQAFTQGIGEGFFGVTDVSTGLSVSAGWFINALAAEVIIRRPATRRITRRNAAHTVTAGI